MCVALSSPSTGFVVLSPIDRVGHPRKILGLARALSMNQPNRLKLHTSKTEMQRERELA